MKSSKHAEDWVHQFWEMMGVSIGYRYMMVEKHSSLILRRKKYRLQVMSLEVKEAQNGLVERQELVELSTACHLMPLECQSLIHSQNSKRSNMQTWNSSQANWAASLTRMNTAKRSTSAQSQNLDSRKSFKLLRIVAPHWILFCARSNLYSFIVAAACDNSALSVIYGLQRKNLDTSPLANYRAIADTTKRTESETRGNKKRKAGLI